MTLLQKILTLIILISLCAGAALGSSVRIKDITKYLRSDSFKFIPQVFFFSSSIFVNFF